MHSVSGQKVVCVALLLLQACDGSGRQEDNDQPGPNNDGTVGEPRNLRIYVSGESIERRNRFVEAPFTAAGALNERDGGLRNDNDEYGGRRNV